MFKLADHPTQLVKTFTKDDLKDSVKQDAKQIGKLQDKLYAENNLSLIHISEPTRPY